MEKKYIKSLLNKQCFRLNNPERKGVLTRIVFHNKDWTICWGYFEWEHGGYIVSIDDLVFNNQVDQTIQQNQQLELF